MTPALVAWTLLLPLGAFGEGVRTKALMVRKRRGVGGTALGAQLECCPPPPGSEHPTRDSKRVRETVATKLIAVNVYRGPSLQHGVDSRSCISGRSLHHPRTLGDVVARPFCRWRNQDPRGKIMCPRSPVRTQLSKPVSDSRTHVQLLDTASPHLNASRQLLKISIF